MSGSATLRIEVAAALPGRQEVIALMLPAGATVRDAVDASGVLERFPELAAAPLVHAVFGVRVKPDHGLSEGDRVELLRPLRVDPKESRRRRAR